MLCSELSSHLTNGYEREWKRTFSSDSWPPDVLASLLGSRLFSSYLANSSRSHSLIIAHHLPKGAPLLSRQLSTQQRPVAERKKVGKGFEKQSAKFRQLSDWLRQTDTCFANIRSLAVSATALTSSLLQHFCCTPTYSRLKDRIPLWESGEWIRKQGGNRVKLVMKGKTFLTA